MSFFKSETSFDLSDTPIESIFIDIYMPMADGNFVKVYLYSYKYACNPSANTTVNNATISKHLNIPLATVLEAWDFWENKQIIKKHRRDNAADNDYAIEFINLKQLFINHTTQTIPTSKQSSGIQVPISISTKELFDANQSPNHKKMFNEIGKIIERGFLTAVEKRQILGWLENYQVSLSLIIRAFDYCKQKKNIKNINYVERKIISWHDIGISDEEQLDQYLLNINNACKLHSRIFKALGFWRSPSESEVSIMNTWVEEYKYNEEIILKACENSSKVSNVTIAYIHGILKNWHKDGVKVISDLESFGSNRNRKPTTSKISVLSQGKTKTKFHLSKSRWSEYTADELEKIFLNKHRKT